MKTDELSEHQLMVRQICKETDKLKQAINIRNIWIRSMEYIFDYTTKERIDFVFQDKFDAYNPEPDTTCYVVELKSEIGDHEMVGQIKKAVQAMEKMGQVNKHWNKVVGIAIAKKYTESGIKLLFNEGYRVFQWVGTVEKFTLNELYANNNKIQKKALHKDLIEYLKSPAKK
jgi:hypothetical protein